MPVTQTYAMPACRFLHQMVQEGLLEPTESKDAYKVSIIEILGVCSTGNDSNILHKHTCIAHCQ